MPIFESQCEHEWCPLFGYPVEHYYPRSDSRMSICACCGFETVKLASAFNVVFTGPITARYNDRGKEGAHLDGHWAWEKGADGKSHPTFIDSWDAQKSYCKRNGLANPREMPANFDVAEDGRTVLNTRGLPGTEI